MAIAKVVNIHAAKTNLSKLVEEAASGREIIIAKAGRPVARLVPFNGARAGRRPGSMRGRIRIADDFDAPLPSDLAHPLGLDE